MRVRFGRHTLDTDTRELLRGADPLRLTGKAFRLLEVLVENRPRALSKDELRAQVWPDVFVSETNVASLVAELREALEEDARRPAAIRTVYGFGYAFCAEVEEAPARPPSAAAAPRWCLRWGRKEIALLEGENILGRGPESIEWFDRETVSRRHARIVIEGDVAKLEDLGSKNGTSLRGERISEPAALADGDEIRLGTFPLTFHRRAVPRSTLTAPEGPG
jgi:DNA-binding winged helix-turn-helix (wHTH) protein